MAGQNIGQQQSLNDQLIQATKLLGEAAAGNTGIGLGDLGNFLHQTSPQLRGDTKKRGRGFTPPSLSSAPGRKRSKSKSTKNQQLEQIDDDSEDYSSFGEEDKHKFHLHLL